MVGILRKFPPITAYHSVEGVGHTDYFNPKTKISRYTTIQLHGLCHHLSFKADILKRIYVPKKFFDLGKNCLPNTTYSKGRLPSRGPRHFSNYHVIRVNSVNSPGNTAADKTSSNINSLTTKSYIKTWLIKSDGKQLGFTALARKHVLPKTYFR